ncbi:phosphatidylinositol polyphosphate phosphatase [Trichoderma longibrachiatum]|uniref:Phosphatidylinositol polyphosphate phosphatase n=1 Tax=Trichoderma citrinoviride TaxID=58853 RepID=A0A2T4AWM2_9HYPO|nr:phosphatidylinositol polyphosphate phosphatase [Trichoderma citrinoviride]PTB61467.1 phosphatidylinositol polyphosphate phosphatase [Trichoderma citrinoviride]
MRNEECQVLGLICCQRSLQEVAPLSYAFIGDYFLKQYLERFAEALNLAASLHSQTGFYQDASAASSASALPLIQTSRPDQGKKHFTLVRALNVGYTAIMLFARHPERLANIQEAEVGFGAAEMGNKGAVGLRALYEAGDRQSTELTFVATHLAAMEWNLPRRNANWGAIMRGLTFENPEEVLSRMRRDAASRGQSQSRSSSSSEDGDASEQARLLREEEHHEQDLRLQQQFHDLSVFKPSSHLFVAGDLNYRISTTSPTPYSAFPNMDPGSENYYTNFLHLDQLTRERLAGRTLHGLSECPVTFPPTYKYVVDNTTPPPADGDDEVKWVFAPHRYPGWTDRILFLEVPPWVDAKMRVRAYDALPVMRTSDHRPVFLRVDVPLVSPADLAPPAAVRESVSASPGGSSSSGSSVVDPRVRLPVEIDPEAWERRLAARRREILAGWTMFLGSTRQGALILGTLLAATAGGYWLFRSSS